MMNKLFNWWWRDKALWYRLAGYPCSYCGKLKVTKLLRILHTKSTSSAKRICFGCYK